MGILLVYDVTDESSFNSISPFLSSSRIMLLHYQAYIGHMVLVSWINI